MNEKGLKRNASRRLVLRIMTYVLLAIWAVMVLFPFYWMVLSSIKSYASYSSEKIPEFIPREPTLE
ncbi:MAG: carbohydrate ABC transporter permease, partial [Clostridia bacterium]|nr:carbohydrate ABC transporter permease [Clostridia bacterium]